MSNEAKNKMATEPVSRIMLSMGIPMILSMMLQAVYNIVDSAFVGGIKDVGELALNALTLAFPVQMLMVAVSIGTGVGMGAQLSRCLGQGDSRKVNKVAGNGIFLAAVIYVVFLIFGIFGAGFYIESQSENAIVIEMAVNYLRICCVASAGIVFFSVFEKMLQSTGKSFYSTIAQIAGAVVNIILDPVLIYGMSVFPAMGVEGAAYATVIGQAVSFLLAFIFHFRVNREIDNGFKYLRPEKQIIKEIYMIGLPAIIAQALMSVMTYALNLILGTVSESAVTAYGMYYKVQQFILFAAFGLRDAITPIVSFNYGMGNAVRVKQGVKWGLTYTTIIMLCGTVALEILAAPLAGLFGLESVTGNMFISAARIISISFVFAGINVALQGVFQATEKGLQSLIVSLLRQCLLILPLVWVFCIVARENDKMMWLVWSSFIVSEFLSMLVSVFFMRPKGD
ncbi:MAG: MATE family efflux transporter [Lachnospiraceae bacterium]